jgi:hypothetical protein
MTVRTILGLIVARRMGIVEVVLTKAGRMISFLAETPVMAMARTVVRGGRGTVLTETLVSLVAGTTDGAVSLTSFTVSTRTGSYAVLPSVKWLSPMLGSGKRAVKMSTSLVMIKFLVRGGETRAVPLVRQRKHAILSSGRAPVGMVSASRVVFLMRALIRWVVLVKTQGTNSVILTDVAGLPRGGWSDTIVGCVLSRRRDLGGSGGLGGRQASVVALILNRISRSQRIGVTIVVAKVSMMGSRRISVAWVGSLE